MLSLTSPRHISTLPIRDAPSNGSDVPRDVANGSNQVEAGYLRMPPSHLRTGGSKTFQARPCL